MVFVVLVAGGLQSALLVLGQALAGPRDKIVRGWLLLRLGPAKEMYSSRKCLRGLMVGHTIHHNTTITKKHFLNKGMGCATGSRCLEENNRQPQISFLMRVAVIAAYCCCCCCCSRASASSRVGGCRAGNGADICANGDLW